MNVISKKVPYLNTIVRNLHSVDKKEFETFFKMFKRADCIVRVGQGRSRKACDLGLYRTRKRVVTRDDIDFPGNNIEEGLAALRKKYQNIVILIVSSSGETKTPKYLAEDVARYLQRTGTKNIKLAAITSRQDSTVGKIAKEYGTVLILQGPKIEAKTSKEAAKAGIMNDIFEFSATMLIHKIKRAVNENKEFNWARRQIFSEMKKIGGITDQFVQTQYYKKLISKLRTRSHVTVGGYGPAEIVAEMTVIRIRHVKKSMGDSAHNAGSYAPNPRPYDIFLAISFSGKTRAIIDWTKEYELNFSITGNNSPLSGQTESFLINQPIEEFYITAVFVLSPISLSLIEAGGFGIRPGDMRYQHSRNE